MQSRNLTAVKHWHVFRCVFGINFLMPHLLKFFFYCFYCFILAVQFLYLLPCYTFFLSHIVSSLFLILSVERQAWKSVSPSRPLKPIISRIVSFHSIFKFEIIRVQRLLLPLFFTKYKLSMSGLVFETIPLILWNNIHSVAGLRVIQFELYPIYKSYQWWMEKGSYCFWSWGIL